MTGTGRLQSSDAWGRLGATSGPRTTGSQRTITVTIGRASAQLTGHTPQPPQVAATLLGSLTRKRTVAKALIDLAVPGRPIGPWSRRTGAPEASATGRD